LDSLDLPGLTSTHHSPPERSRLYLNEQPLIAAQVHLPQVNRALVIQVCREEETALPLFRQGDNLLLC